MSECRSCGAEIEWAKTAAGKRIPLDAESVIEGNIELSEGGMVRVVRNGSGDRVSHFATCPNAKEHRR